MHDILLILRRGIIKQKKGTGGSITISNDTAHTIILHSIQYKSITLYIRGEK